MLKNFLHFRLCKLQDYAKSRVIGAHAEYLQDPAHLPSSFAAS
jgi:hypothetical protein